MANALETTIRLLGRIDPSLSRAMATGERMAARSGKNIGKLFAAGAVAVGAAVVAGAGIAIKAATEYETSLAKVSTIADTTHTSLAQISDDTLKLSSATGMAAADVNEATYQAISAGVKTEEATQFVGVAAKAAKGGFTDVTTAVDGLTTVLNSYGLGAENADKIANQMLVTQNLGKTSFGELAQSVGKLTPIMNSANVGTDEMFSSLAALTANGIETSEAVSGMKAAVSNIIKPTAEASKMAASLGLDFSSTALQSKGLAGFLQDVKDKTGGNLDTMSKLFGSMEGLNSVLSLTSDQGMALMSKSMEEMQTNTTALEDAYNKMASTPAERIDKLKNKVSNLAIQTGEKLLPIAEAVMEKIESIDFEKISGELQWFIDNGQVIAGIAVAVGAGMATWNVINMLQGVVGAVKAWTIATQGMSAVQRVMNILQLASNAIMAANPIGIVVAAVVGLTAGFVYLVQKTGSVKGAFEAVWGVIKKVGDIIGGVLSKIKEFLGFGGSSKSVTVGAETASVDIPQYATGGTVTMPHLAVVGDVPETIVPHGNTTRNRALLAQAARGVGASNGGGTSFSVNFTAQIMGGSASEVKAGVLDAEQEFESRMNAFLSAKARRAFT